MIVGDKAYIANRECITPTKLQRSRRLTPEEVHTNKYIQLIRTPVERAVARLHRMRMVKYCSVNEKLSDGFMHMAALMLNVESSQPWSTWLQPRSAPASVTTREEAKKKCGIELLADGVDLKGRNSTKRARDDREFKTCTFDYEKVCAKCGNERSLCQCTQQRGRGRAGRGGRGAVRGRGRVGTVDERVESSSSSDTSRSSDTQLSSSDTDLERSASSTDSSD